MGRLSAQERDIAARVFRFLVTPSGTKIALHARDLAEYTEIAVGKVEPLLSKLSEPQARILRGVGENRYEIYHDVLAAAILDWRARYFQSRQTALSPRIGLSFLAAFIGTFIGYLYAAPHTTAHVLGWLTAASAVGALATLAPWLLDVATRRDARRVRGIVIGLFCLFAGALITFQFAPPRSRLRDLLGTLSAISAIGACLLIFLWGLARVVRRQSQQ